MSSKSQTPIAKYASLASVLILFAMLSNIASGDESPARISKDAAIQSALSGLGIEVLGVRFDEPDTQWDVFIKSDEQAFEVEVDALTGNVIAIEKESLAEVQAELAGDLSHEGVEGDVDK